jgi:aspartokinase/homoserine dehydrogenase 1
MKVLKFGGSSVGSAEALENVYQILSSYKKESPVVVVSALHGITDKLVKVAALAQAGAQEYKTTLAEIVELHHSHIRQLFATNNQTKVKQLLELNFTELADLLHGIFVLKELTLKIKDQILSFGERCSALLIAEFLKERGLEADFVDAREIIKTDDRFGNARVLLELSRPLIEAKISTTKLPIVTGFIGSTVKGETTTLGRGGSDYTASILGVALDAAEIQIWTDVNGMMSADPRKVSDALSIAKLSYEEAMELAHFGAKVIYPPTIQPARKRGIPIVIKNTFQPEFAGTLIGNEIADHGNLITGISSIEGLSLLRIEGSAMYGAAGFASRLFRALADANVNVILITQASSEHSICVAIFPEAEKRSVAAINQEFSDEQSRAEVEPVAVENNLSIVSVVGAKMKHTPGTSARLFRSLGRSGVNVIAIAQGSSELSISVVIQQAETRKALNVIHEEFFLSKKETLNLSLAGVGLVGKELLKQIQENSARLRETMDLDIKVVALATSKGVTVNDEGINLETYQNLLSEDVLKGSLDELVSRVIERNLPNSVFLDCTASDDVPKHFPALLRSNISVITANKRAFTGPIEEYQKLRELARKRGVEFLYETCVGAGLPVISAIKDLLKSGDEIYKIEAVLSGTLSFLFNNFNGTKPFSQLVREAKDKGFTEPDPREDLSGTDVGRKLLVLAREIGLPYGQSDLRIQNLVPADCAAAKSVSEFFQLFKEHDDYFDNLREIAAEQGKVLRYIGTVSKDSLKTSLDSVGLDHPFYSLSGSDNIISVTSKRYFERPLVVKGPGAGAEVTAAGIFADIIRIPRRL